MTGTLVADTMHASYIVAIAGDAPDQIYVGYNISAPDDSSDEVPKSTSDALNGPHPYIAAARCKTH